MRARRPGDSGPPVADFPARRAAAYQAFYEHMPVRAAVLTQAFAGLAAGAEMRLYSQQRFGRLATIVLLDDRQYRDPQVCSRGGRRGSSQVEPGGLPGLERSRRARLLGAAQERWLDGATGAAQDRAGPSSASRPCSASATTLPGPGQSLWNDGWDGYAAARGRFARSLQRSVANPVLLGGDVHENWVGHVKADYSRPDSPAIGVEFCGTSITSRSGGTRHGWPSGWPRTRTSSSPTPSARATGWPSSRRAGSTTTLRVVDDVTRRDTKIETLARFVVEAGRAQLETM